MQTKGLFKIFLIMGVDFLVVNYFCNTKISLICICLLALYVFWIGEVLDFKKMHAIKMEHLSEMDKSRLLPIANHLLEQVRQNTTFKNFSVNISVIPTDDFNTYTYGIHNIAITQGALRNLDSSIVGAMLSHEIGHILALDVVIKRLLITNIILIISVFIISKYMFLAIIILIIGVLALLGMFTSCFSWFIIAAIIKGIKKIGDGVCQILLGAMQSLVALFGRHRENKADQFACEMGYEASLTYYLTRFINKPQPAEKLSDLLYNTHPLPLKRLQNIKKLKEQQIIPKSYPLDFYKK